MKGQSTKYQKNQKKNETKETEDGDEIDGESTNQHEIVQMKRSIVWMGTKNIRNSDLLFSIVSYNILADSYVKPTFFPWSSKQELIWKNRVALLQTEMKSLAGDICCLQEDEQNEMLTKFFEAENYQNSFIRRTGSRKDGCSIYFRSSKFCLVTRYAIELNDMTEDKTLKHDNVALFLVLQSLLHETQICVGCVHLYYKDPKTRKKQVEDINSVLKTIENTFGNIPIVISGDFNDGPQSAVCKLHQQLSGMQHIYQFEEAINGSAYPFTSFCQRTTMIDYIWFKNVALQAVLSLPNNRAYLPNLFHGSDHIPIQGFFSF